MELTGLKAENVEDEGGYTMMSIYRQTSIRGLAGSEPGPQAPSSLWRPVALALLVLCLLSLSGVVTLGTMIIMQQNHSSIQDGNVSQTLQQLARRFCQELVAKPRGHKCNPCSSSKYHQGNCYHLYLRNRTWEENRIYCASKNYTLVKVDNQEELAYLTRSTHKIRWIGLSRTANDAPWTWEDGSVPAVDLFQLSGDEEAKHCALFHNGKIEAAGCQENYPSLCESVGGNIKIDLLL
ncbi:C-type lectin domain family 1 member B-like [Tachyglossus aculeatus]|uniref:C-type lectin domain family 1 member B-like n=1 Tax=Tachyglossus aculeatus TaxID=9261 RepID=UPI0018F2D09E|nr:C-type lectin domain family 1 member B-like [Tachyglossus aculeatus]